MNDKFKINKIEFDIIERNSDYVIIEYNDVEVMLDSTMKLFNASKLIELINPSEDENGRVISKWEQLWNNQSFYQFNHYYGGKAEIIDINKGKHCNNKGKYLPIELFNDFLKAYDFMFYRYWKSGKSINELPAYVYFEHDSSLKNTEFKLGCTWNLQQRLNNYRTSKAKDAHYLCVLKVTNKRAAERIFKNVVKRSKAIHIKGETYAFDDSDHVINTLDELLSELMTNKLYIDDAETFLFDEAKIREEVNGL